jgi:long-chain fatty acid transport protein
MANYIIIIIKETMNITCRYNYKNLAKLILLFLLGNNVWGAGYQISINSAKAIGQANAGDIASENVLVTMLNPAAIMSLEGSNYSTGFTLLNLEYEFDLLTSPLEGANILGITTPYELQLPGDPGPAGAIAGAPSVGYAKNLGKWGYGFFTGPQYAYDFDPKVISSIATTFGDFYVKSIHLTGNLAYKINDNLDVGVGLSIIPITMKVERNLGEFAPLIDKVEDALSDIPFIGVLDDFVLDKENGLLSGIRDKNSYAAKYTGTAVGVGLSFGLNYQASHNSRYSFAYHHKAGLNFKGSYVSDLVDLPFFAVGTSGKEIDAETKLTLPNWVSIAGAHKFSDYWEVTYGIRWTAWESNFKGLAVTANDGSGRGASFDIKTRDTYRYNIGLIYDYSDKLKLRTGLAFDKSYHKKTDVLINSPDANRVWIGAGYTYKTSEKTSWDVGLAYIYFDHGIISEPETLLEQIDVLANENFKPSSVLLGEDRDTNIEVDAKMHVHVASIQYNKRF